MTSSDFQAQSRAIETQPYGTVFSEPGSVHENGVSVRTLRDTPEDAEFAGRLVVEAFRGKIAHNITERKLHIAVKHMVASHRGQAQDFYDCTFVAELAGRPVGLVKVQFKGDKEIDRDDHINEMGCWHAIRYSCLGSALTNEVEKSYECYLDHICVDECARGKGVGKALMQRAEQEARARNCLIIYLWVLTNNRARNLYERQGYRITQTASCCLGFCLGPPGSTHKMEKNL